MDAKKRLKLTGWILVIFVALSVVLFIANKYLVRLINSLIEEPIQLPLNLNFSFILFYTQWIILGLVFALIYFKKIKKKDYVKPVEFIAPEKKGEAETDLDTLYNTLKKSKKITIKQISKSFNIPEFKALEWAKILESHDLAHIDYPLFASPQIKLKKVINEDEEIKPVKAEPKKDRKKIAKKA